MQDQPGIVVPNQKVAITALFLALGATDEEIEPALRIVYYDEVPDDLAGIAKQARRALALVRGGRGRPA